MAKGMSAHEIADLVVEKKVKKERDSYLSLRRKCTAKINEMVEDLQQTVEVELNDDDLVALNKVTEELRELDYRFKFIEVQDTSGNVIEHKLMISIAHAF